MESGGAIPLILTPSGCKVPQWVMLSSHSVAQIGRDEPPEPDDSYSDPIWIVKRDSGEIPFYKALSFRKSFRTATDELVLADGWFEHPLSLPGETCAFYSKLLRRLYCR